VIGRISEIPGKKLSEFQMESCVMSKPPKLGFKFWGFSLDAEGALGVIAAIVICLLVLIAYRF
jgi:hypothetical protein